MLFSKLLLLLGLLQTALASGPFFLTLSNTSHVIGNDLWNITVGTRYGTKLWYKGKDLVGKASGHYVSHSGGTSLDYTSARIVSQTKEYLDVVFVSPLGDLHWVIFPDLAGAYQYFVNRALPVLGEFRTIVRLDNTTFVNGKNAIKDGPLPTLAEIAASTKVQDETWQKADGTFITKYDWADFIRNQHYYGVYGNGYGSWYIYPGKDEYNGNHLKQELLVHRETATGDTVQLNMIHGTHFQAVSSDTFAVGKTWGPWLWYLNDGTASDVAARATKEEATWPYKWFNSSTYQSRGCVSGTLKLSDGRPASGAAVFLGDNNSNLSTLDQGALNYYTAYADNKGFFSIPNVRSGVYALHSWSNGGSIADITTNYIKNDITISANKEFKLGTLVWKTQGRKKIFQIGDMDRKSLGFKYGGAPHQHALSANCPSNLTYTIGSSKTSDWCYVQSSLGTWSINFPFSPSTHAPNDTKAVLSISLAGYSSGVSSNILVNGLQVGNLTSASILNDPSVYRSATTAGEWHYFEFGVESGILKSGDNKVEFVVTRESLWHGFMWDSVMLELV